MHEGIMIEILKSLRILNRKLCDTRQILGYNNSPLRVMRGIPTQLLAIISLPPSL